MRVIGNTATALDGRIATAAYDHFALGTWRDRAYMSVLRARADAVLVGGRTFRNWPLPLVPDPEAIARLRAESFFDADVPPIVGRRWINAVITRSLPLPDAPRFWGEPRVEPRIYAPEPGPSPALVVGPTDPHTVAADLAARGVKTLLLECGGDLMAQWLAADLVDELHVTICPLVLGGKGAPTLVDGAGFSPEAAPRLRLLHAHPVGDELYVRYAVNRMSR